MAQAGQPVAAGAAPPRFADSALLGITTPLPVGPSATPGHASADVTAATSEQTFTTAFSDIALLAPPAAEDAMPVAPVADLAAPPAQAEIVQRVAIAAPVAVAIADPVPVAHIAPEPAPETEPAATSTLAAAPTLMPVAAPAPRLAAAAPIVAAPPIGASSPPPPPSVTAPARPATLAPPQPALAAPPPDAAPAPALIEASANLADGATPPPAARARPAIRTDLAESTISYDNELILQIRVAGIPATDTIIAYGTREAVYLPLGELARILDLAIRISDDGHYASGWFLTEDRTLTIDLRQGTITTQGSTRPLPPGMAQAFDGELYLRTEAFAEFFPLTITPDLRAQAVTITTLEPFPFEERMRRDEQRARLAGRSEGGHRVEWPRAETSWRALSPPLVDVELQAISDTPRGTRGQADLRIAGDLAFMTAQTFLSANSKEGLVAAHVELGRRDADADLLGPLRATEFQIGDVGTTAMTIGLRGASGRGVFVTNEPLASASVFEQIDLRGALPDGYEVEIYRNDILLGSTRNAVNGQYEFLQVGLDYGINVLRLVFYGPQGQRHEEVRRINVGDGRLSAGRLEYTFGAVQRDTNLLGIERPDFIPRPGYGEWQGTGEVSYGFSQKITGVASAAFFQEGGEDNWLASAGLRTSIGSLAIRADAGVNDDSGQAFGLGMGGRALGGAFALSHFEYRGDFIDELRSQGSAALRRATELDLNFTLALGSEDEPLGVPLTLRARSVEFANGRTQTNAALRGSLRLPGVIGSNTLEFSHNSSPSGPGFSQLVGNFDLASFNRSKTQLRGSLGYRVLPDPAITSISGELSHQFDRATVLRGSAGYALENKDLTLGLSAVREFAKFTLALDGQYALGDNSYSVALRLGFSFGHDPLRRRFFVDGPGLASAGAAAVRAFQDFDGDGLLGPGDQPLEEVAFSAGRGTMLTDASGTTLLTRLGHGTRANVVLEQGTLPDILMAPTTGGIEIIPRPGRIHVADFPVVLLGEVEGTVTFADGDNARGVSGLRLGFADEAGEVAEWIRTERGGYYFYERVRPGRYRIVIDPEQSARLGVCVDAEPQITVDQSGDFQRMDFAVRPC